MNDFRGRELSRRRVLVVEDEYFVADDISRELRAHGADILGPVPTLEDALGLLGREERIDGAVLDVNLRGEMAFPVADALMARGVPFVFSTGYDPSVMPPRYRDVPRWEKPYRYGDLARALPQLLRGRGQDG